MNDPVPEKTPQTLPYSETEIETMADEDARAGRFLTKMLVFTFCYTIIVGAYVIYWSLQN